MSILKFKQILKSQKIAQDINKNRNYFNKEPEYFFILSFKEYHRSNNDNKLEPLILLDEEDIEYFKNKYFKKLEEEKQAEIEAIELKYKL